MSGGDTQHGEPLTIFGGIRKSAQLWYEARYWTTLLDVSVACRYHLKLQCALMPPKESSSGERRSRRTVDVAF